MYFAICPPSDVRSDLIYTNSYRKYTSDQVRSFSKVREDCQLPVTPATLRRTSKTISHSKPAGLCRNAQSVDLSFPSLDRSFLAL